MVPTSMELLLLILAACLATVSVTADQHQQNNALYRCGIRKRFGTQLIHNARTAELGQWPWHAAIFHRNRTIRKSEYRCGATLIDQQHVLTSAHCVVDRSSQSLEPHQLRIHLGKHELLKFDRNLQIFNVSEVHIHEDYSPNRHDLALLVLESVVRYSEFVVPICLEPVPGGKADDLIGRRGSVAGWGVDENGSLSKILKTAEMPVVEITECARSDPNLFGRFVSPAVYCASDRNGTSVCLGDSGGGMYFSVDDRWELRGIVSFSGQSKTGSCDTRSYVMFTNVAYYHPWIRSLTDGRIGHINAESKTVSERKCEEYAAMARKQSNGVCNNARSPHTVSVIYDGNSSISCSAAVISELYVLSAAICGELDSQPIKVRAGSQEEVNIVEIFVHPMYDNRSDYSSANNLVLMKLEKPLVLGSRFLPACLANPATENLYNSLMVTGYAGKHRRFYENVNIWTISTAECITRLPPETRRTLASDEVCVLARHDAQLAGGDHQLGASLQKFNSRSCMFTILGVSHVVGQELEIYTRVAPLVEWIEGIVWLGRNVGGKKIIRAEKTEKITPHKPIRINANDPFAFARALETVSENAMNVDRLLYGYK